MFLKPLLTQQGQEIKYKNRLTFPISFLDRGRPSSAQVQISPTAAVVDRGRVHLRERRIQREFAAQECRGGH